MKAFKLGQILQREGAYKFQGKVNPENKQKLNH